eukprot:TRINITY_DN3913_c0_g1_i1.p1 TRINITY_DN3913_c0_g1~~TRINITY_DN3913_c0_g1_i1.p1  ORF type:complete len:323 (-),score=48.33 TRINITY_DN3913_c0_g1_i1:75-941(-)
MAVRAARNKTWFRLEDDQNRLRPSDLYIPALPFPQHPWVFVVSRGLILIHGYVVFGVALNAYGDMEGSPGRFFIYNSNWSYVMLLLYFSAMWVLSVYHWVERSKPLHSPALASAPPVPSDVALPERANWFHKLLWLTYETALTAGWTVAILFWLVIKGMGCLRTGEDCEWHAYAFHGHGVNTFWMLTELVFTRMRIIPTHVVFSVCYIVTWLTFSIWWHSYAGEWLYDVQNPQKAMFTWMSYVFYPGFVLAYILIFYAGYYTDRTLRRLFKKQPRATAVDASAKQKDN